VLDPSAASADATCFYPRGIDSDAALLDLPTSHIGLDCEKTTICTM
jgi:hypothetical protein